MLAHVLGTTRAAEALPFALRSLPVRSVTSITLTLDIGGHPAAASQIYLGGTPANPASGSPVAFTR